MPSKPVLQILGINKIIGSDQRFQLLVSDGKHYQSFVLLPPYLDAIFNGDFAIYSVIRFDKFIITDSEK